MKTSRALSPILHVGNVTIAAIEERQVSARATSRRVIGHGAKTACAVLFVTPTGARFPHHPS